jgi:hypothetical protein
LGWKEGFYTISMSDYVIDDKSSIAMRFIAGLMCGVVGMFVVARMMV